jgi:hypothetical protein
LGLGDLLDLVFFTEIGESSLKVIKDLFDLSLAKDRKASFDC